MRVPVRRNGTARRGELDRPRAAANDVLSGAHTCDDLDGAPVTSPDPNHSPLERFALDLDEYDAGSAIIHERRLRHGERPTFVSMNEKRTGERSDGEAPTRVVDGEQYREGPRNGIHHVPTSHQGVGG